MNKANNDGVNNKINNNIIYELHKLSSVILPEKQSWSLDEIYNNLYRNAKNKGTKKDKELKENLKDQLLKLEKKDAVIFINGFDSFSLVGPKLLDLINIPNTKKI